MGSMDMMWFDPSKKTIKWFYGYSNGINTELPPLSDLSASAVTTWGKFIQKATMQFCADSTRFSFFVSVTEIITQSSCIASVTLKTKFVQTFALHISTSL